jgi:hypothetical protein
MQFKDIAILGVSFLLLAVACNRQPLTGTQQINRNESQTPYAAKVPADWPTYTYKNLSFKYPRDWEVSFDSQVAGQPNGFALHVNEIKDHSIQPDEISLSTYDDSNTDNGQQSSYLLNTNRNFVLNKDGQTNIQFIDNGTAIFSICGYWTRGQSTVDICNQIASTVMIK